MIYAANKDYVCCLCGELILKGTRYWKKSKLRGKQHLNCCEHEPKNPVTITEPKEEIQDE